MTVIVLIKVMLWWAAILVMAMLNGIIREKLLIPLIGSFAALLASGIILSCLIFVISYLAVPTPGALEASQYWLIGSIWLLMTLAFEFGFGFIQRKKLSEMLSAYTFKGGNIWPVVLASTLISPWLAAHFRGLILN